MLTTANVAMLHFPSRPRRLLVLTTIVSLFAAAGCHHADVRRSLPVNHFVGGSADPMMLAAYQPWFGRANHLNLGYSSQDRVVIEKQIDKAKHLGISAFVVNWYGSHNQFEDNACALMQQLAGERNLSSRSCMTKTTCACSDDITTNCALSRCS